nr:hypothetical protein [uncultured Mediterranean phage uvMED]BAR29141.1 hypothetical protein [uncultured Mediterranean phage uvMED]|tara:strand:- start:191 stop:400 length:210 start_codon:yes stop_codon:yes gene_type:complete
MKSYKRQMDVESFMLENEFEDYCRERFDRINIACDFLGIINDEDYVSFKMRNYTNLEIDFLNSIDKTIH